MGGRVLGWPIRVYVPLYTHVGLSGGGGRILGWPIRVCALYFILSCSCTNPSDCQSTILSPPLSPQVECCREENTLILQFELDVLFCFCVLLSYREKLLTREQVSQHLKVSQLFGYIDTQWSLESFIRFPNIYLCLYILDLHYVIAFKIL